MSFLSFVLCLILVVAVFWAGCLMGFCAGVESTKKRTQQLLDAWAADNQHARIVVRWKEEEKT